MIAGEVLENVQRLTGAFAVFDRPDFFGQFDGCAMQRLVAFANADERSAHGGPHPGLLSRKVLADPLNALEKEGVGKWGFATDPHEIARLMIANIDKKRKQLGIDKARERVLLVIADRREMDSA